MAKCDRSRIGRSSRNKGKVGEREARDVINQLLGTNCRRGQQRSGLDQQDVVDHIPLTHIEVKRVEKLNLYAAMQQAEEDRQANEVPWVLHRRNEERWMLTIYWEDLIAFVRRLLLVKKIKPLKRRTK